MKTRQHPFQPFLVMFVLLVGAHSALAEVRDDAKFFSEDAVRQANFDLREIKQKYGKDLLVETHPAVPADLQSQMATQGKDKLFAEWAQERGREAKLDGVIVLVTREPSHLQIGVGNKTQQKAFTLRDRDRMKQTMLTSFKQKQFDQGLLSAVQMYRETLAANLGGATSSQVEQTSPTATPAPQPPQSNPGAFDPRSAERSSGGGGGISFGSILLWFAIIMVGVWLVRRLFRRRTAGGTGMMGQPGYGRGYGNQPGQPNQPGYGDQPGYNRGGGFGTGLGGGILGGMLGGWLGSHMFGHGSGGGNAAHGATPPPTGTGQEPGVFSSEHDANFASSGGDFGSDSSDFGGGGGDFGGGDSGGGGDF